MRSVLPFRQQIYGSGTIYGGPADAVELSDAMAGAAGISLRGEVFPLTHYDREHRAIISENPEFVNTIDTLFSRIGDHFDYAPASVALDFEDCVVFNGIVHIPQVDGLGAIQPSYRENDRPFVSPLSADIDIESIEQYEAGDRSLVYLTSAGSLNYGHWLVDDLTRLKYVFDDDRPVTLLLQSAGDMTAIRDQSLALLLRGRDVQIRTLGAGEALRCRSLTYVTPVSYHPYVKNPLALNWLRDQIRKGLELKGDTPRRLFVRRSPVRPGGFGRRFHPGDLIRRLTGRPPAGHGRQITNALEIEACARAAGFYVCDPALLSFEGQMRLFAGAEIVVGIMGAAMCNTIASGPGTQLLYLAPEGWVEPFYWDMAAVLSQGYSAIAGRRAQMAEPAHCDNFRIDPELFKSALAAFDKG